jgi:hypothetical protein
MIPPILFVFAVLALLASARAGYSAGRGGRSGLIWLAAVFALPLVWLLSVGVKLDHALSLLALGALIAPAGYRLGRSFSPEGVPSPFDRGTKPPS